MLYHGTLQKYANDITTNGVNLGKTNAVSDFGQGFYTTTIKTQAEAWAAQAQARISDDRIRQLEDNKPVIIRYEVNREELGNLSTLVFLRGDFTDEDFWSFIFHCRAGNLGHNLINSSEYYDIVYGPVTDFWRQRSIKANSDQISFHTTIAIKILVNPLIFPVI